MLNYALLPSTCRFQISKVLEIISSKKNVLVQFIEGMHGLALQCLKWLYTTTKEISLMVSSGHYLLFHISGKGERAYPLGSNLISRSGSKFSPVKFFLSKRKHLALVYIAEGTLLRPACVLSLEISHQESSTNCFKHLPMSYGCSDNVHMHDNH